MMSWEISTTGPVLGVEWCADKEKLLFAAVSEGKVVVGSPLDLLPPSGQTAILDYAHGGFSLTSEGLPAPVEDVKWTRRSKTSDHETDGILLEISVPGTPKQIKWHRKGDYLATVAPDAGGRSVLMHQITKHSTQAPFSRLKGVVQCVAFHPTRPHFLVATERAVRIYDLMAKGMIKQLQPNVRHVSSVDVHPMGEFSDFLLAIPGCIAY
jgi:ribosome biogenesis protein ERB1